MFGCIKEFFRKKPTSYYNFLIERDNEDRKYAQILEDQRIDRNIKYEARRLFNEWYNAPIITIGGKEYKNCIQIIQPFGICYHIHDEDTAKYSGKNISKLVQEEFKKYKEDFNDIRN